MSRYQDYNHQQSFYNHHHHHQPANDPNNNYYHNYRPSQHNIQTEDYRKMVNTNFHGGHPPNAFEAVETRRATTTDGLTLEHKTCYQQKCLCCPYGFHIDLDFLRYLESLRREMHARSQSPRKVRTADGGRPQLSSAGGERYAFSEDESMFEKRTAREKRPDSARANLPDPSYPYVVKPKAEPDVLVAIPDELKTQRSELFLDTDAERKFRASTQLFIKNEREPRLLEVDVTYDEETSDVKLRRSVDSGLAAGDLNRVAHPRYRSSVALFIEQLENCLATSQTLVSAPDSSRSEKEDEGGQLTKVQVLCSKIISKLRRLHELEEKVRLIPDLDEHILSLTRQLDQLKMKQHQQREEPCELNPKARSRASTRDVGVGNGVLFPRTGGSTSPTLKKFADISAFSLPPPPHSSRKVREVSIQVNTPPNQWQNLNKTSERKLFMNHGSGFDNDLKTGDSSKGFCCTKCGSTEVAKLQTDVADVERGVSNIINSFNKTFQPVKLPNESINNSDISDRPKKTPPAVAPKPKVSAKTSSDPEINEVNKQDEVFDLVKIVSKEKPGDQKDQTSVHFHGLLEGSVKEINEEFAEVELKTSSRISTFSEKETLSGLEHVAVTSLDDTVNPFIDNLQTYVLKRDVTMTTPTSDAGTPSLTTTVEVFPVEVTSPAIVPVVIDLLESSSESEELEKIDSFLLDEKRSTERTSSDRKVSKDLVNNESSECLISEITIEENTDDRSEEIKVKDVVTSDLKKLQDKEVDSLNKNSWISSIASKILDEASKYASSFSSRKVSKLPTTVKSRQDAMLKSTDASLENADLIETIQIAPSCDNVKPDIAHSSPVSCEMTGKDLTDEVVKITASPHSSASSPSTGSSSLSSSPGFATKSSHTPNAPHSSLVNVEEYPASDVYLNAMEMEEVVTPSEIKRNLFAETLTSDVVLTTTSESSEAENWGELASLRDLKERNLFTDSHGLFLKAAAGKIGALSDPGELWKNKSFSSDFTATSSGDDDDDDDYCSSSSAAEASAKKGYQLDSKDLPAIKEDKTSVSSLGIEPTESKDVGTRPDVSGERVVVNSETLMSKASTSDNIVVSARSQAKRSHEKVRPCSSGYEMEGVDFVPLDSPSSTITSQSLDAGINEELASIRSPCELSLLRSPVPLIQVIPSSATPTASLGLSSDLSIFEEEDPNVVMTTSVEHDDEDDDFQGSPKTGVATVTDEACGISSTALKGEDEKTAEEEEDCFLEACVIYANWLTDPTSISDSEKDAIVELIRKDWFLNSGRKMSQGSEVRNALSTMRNFGDLFMENVINMADGDGNTTLHYAVSHGNGSVIEALLETGLCDGDRQNNAGYTPIMLAALLIEDVNRNFELLKALFESGDINTASDRSGQTALMLASSHGREEMVMVLLECGADVNIQDEDGSTALMCASEHGHVGIIKALLAHPNCNSSLSDIDGSTALSIAMEEGNHDIGILIYAHMKVHGAVEDEDQQPAL